MKQPTTMRMAGSTGNPFAVRFDLLAVILALVWLPSWSAGEAGSKYDSSIPQAPSAPQ